MVAGGGRRADHLLGLAQPGRHPRRACRAASSPSPCWAWRCSARPSSVRYSMAKFLRFWLLRAALRGPGERRAPERQRSPLPWPTTGRSDEDRPEFREPDRPHTSTRDRITLVRQLVAWLAEQLRADDVPRIDDVRGPDGAGLSSETMLFDFAWSAGGEQRAGSYVLRLPPPADAYPLFPKYELERQVAAMRFVRDRSRVPVPAVLWFEPDPDVLGPPFFVMEQIDGVAVPDMPPYVFGQLGHRREALTSERPPAAAAPSTCWSASTASTATHGDLAPWSSTRPATRRSPPRREPAALLRLDPRRRSGSRLIDATFGWLDRALASRTRGPAV